jgi:Fe2+ transport system protein A
MMLSMAKIGETVTIKKITGKDDTRRFLANLGFIEGVDLRIVSELNGDMIINIKESRIALGKSMGNRVIVALNKEK